MLLLVATRTRLATIVNRYELARPVLHLGNHHMQSSLSSEMINNTPSDGKVLEKTVPRGLGNAISRICSPPPIMSR